MGAAADDLTCAGNRSQLQGIFPAAAVFHRPGAGGVIGQIASHGTKGGAGGVGRPEKAMLGGGLLYLLIGNTRLHRYHAIGRIHINNFVHLFKRHDQPAPYRHGSAGGACAPASCGEGNFEIVAGFYNIRHLSFCVG